MSKVNTIARLDPRIVYTGSAWTNLGTAAQDPVAGGVTSATNATNGRGQFGAGSGALNGYSIMKGTGAGITPMVSGVDFTYDSRLDTTGGSNVNVYDTGTASNLASGKYFRIVEGAGNIASSIYPKSPGTPSYGLQIVAKDLTTEVSPPETQCYVDPVKGKFTLPRPSYWSKCESPANILAPEIGVVPRISSANSYTSVGVTGKFGSGVAFYSNESVGWISIEIDLQNVAGSSGISSSFWIKCGILSGSYHAAGCYVAVASGVAFYVWELNGTQTVELFVDSVSVASSSISFSSAFMHVFYYYDGSVVKIFCDGVIKINYSVSRSLGGSNRSMSIVCWNSGLGTATTTIDNLKIWNHVVSTTPDFEYNSGTGRESALHYIYGSANNYAPAITGTNNGVCYDWTSLPTDPVKLTKGSDVIATLENASNISAASGSFGNPSNLSTNAYVQLVAGTHFQYDKRLDASTTEDPTNGFGATAGGITDTGVSGALAANKYIRVVEDGAVAGTKNIADAAGLNLDIYAKEIVNEARIFPPSTQCYVDPERGKFVLPRPIYWSKCESLANIAAAELSDGTATYTVPVNWGWTAHGVTAAKFGNGIYSSASGPAGARGESVINIYPFYGVTRQFTKGTISLWTAAYSNNAGTAGYVYIGHGTVMALAIRTNIGENSSSMYINNVVASTVAGGWGAVPFAHIYMVWDWDKTLTGGKSVRIFKNGAEILSSTAQWTAPTGQDFFIQLTSVVGSGGTGIAQVDNIKMWDHVVSEDPTFEYNAGTGRESALHNMYGATNSYVPKLIAPGGVGYFKAGSSGNYATMTF